MSIAKQYLSLPVFQTIRDDVRHEVVPLLESMDPLAAPRRYMPFRVIQVGNVVERMYAMRLRTSSEDLAGRSGRRGLMQQIYDRKYLRFGTSGVRGRWGVDLTEVRVRQVVQSICEFLKAENVPDYAAAENLAGRRIVVGYDSRRNANQVARWAAEVCLGNGFAVDFAARDTPTPALVYYLTDYLDPDAVAGLINCTPSHNPPEWQGIKFNPRLGYPAPTAVTDHVAARINELQLLDEQAQIGDVLEGEATGRLRGFDPLPNYAEWILNSGKGNGRVSIDIDRIRQFHEDKLLVIDEMHGAGRGYLSKILGEIGVRHTVVHAERDPDFGDLDYANPEEPFVETLKSTVARSGATLGLGLDADADRFGVVDRGGVYFRPNQIVPMLIRYLGLDRGIRGRIVATQTGSPIIPALAALMDMHEDFRPAGGVVPAYIAHPFYQVIIGSPKDRVLGDVFLVPVGVKYIEEMRRSDRSYRPLPTLPADWRDTLLIGGEESSGVCVRGHVPDKDGVWGDLLVLDMLAFYGTEKNLESIQAIWDDTVALPGCWRTYGGREPESNSGRLDVDAVLEAKEALLDFFLGPTESTEPRLSTYAGLEVTYLGGIQYDVVEIQLRSGDDDRHYLRVRASGTEPISRIYVESSDRDVARKLMETTLGHLERLCINEVNDAWSEWRLADILAYTSCSDGMLKAVRDRLDRESAWSAATLIQKLESLAAILERRGQRTANTWIRALADAP